ncbi:hypothetical protein AB0F88_26225 [Streptosporangium sp. NPDC023963]|uniref:hypothetical protein n=1 Tax=Streptosporangium sp. NPDC023963 TaxID=3155608 RepID=UPI00343F3C24
MVMVVAVPGVMVMVAVPGVMVMVAVPGVMVVAVPGVMVMVAVPGVVMVAGPGVMVVAVPGVVVARRGIVQKEVRRSGFLDRRARPGGLSRHRHGDDETGSRQCAGGENLLEHERSLRI